jgi:hypothetical protein
MIVLSTSMFFTGKDSIKQALANIIFFLKWCALQDIYIYICLIKNERPNSISISVWTK